MSTHIVSDLEAIANEMILLKKGRILAQSKPAELLEQINGTVWTVTVPTEEEAVLTAGYACSNIMHTEGKSIIRMLSEQKPHKNALSVIPNMEDVYLYYFGK